MENNQQNIKKEDDPLIGTLIFDRYKLLKKLCSGSFGSIYSAEYQQKFYAIKLEDKKIEHHLLEHEANIMSYLRSPALPVVTAFGYSSQHNILVMELMGKSLEDIFEEFPYKKFSVRCVCNIGFQMVEILEFIHNKHIIHRDIKPDNFVVGLNEKRKYVYILDFGLSKKYRSSKTLKHYPVIKSKNLTGTARYASINALNGLTQSRRDDLEAVGYVLMYFLRGRLPWQGIPVKNKEERYRKIMEKKKATSAEDLCKGFPRQFTDYINYTRNLAYEQEPNYDYLKNLFITTLNNEGFNIDCYYDWDQQTIQYSRSFKTSLGINRSSSTINKNTKLANSYYTNKSNYVNRRINDVHYKDNSNNLSTANNITSNNFFGSSMNNNNEISALGNYKSDIIDYNRNPNQKNSNVLNSYNKNYVNLNNNPQNIGQSYIRTQKTMIKQNTQHQNNNNKNNDCCLAF